MQSAFKAFKYVSLAAVFAVAALIAWGYVGPGLAWLTFRGDAKYYVTFSAAPYFTAYTARMSPIALNHAGEHKFAFQGFYTTNSNTWVELCLNNPDAIAFAEISTEIDFTYRGDDERIIFQKSGSLTEFDYLGPNPQRSKMMADSRTTLCIPIAKHDPQWSEKYQITFTITRTDEKYPNLSAYIELGSGPK